MLVLKADLWIKCMRINLQSFVYKLPSDISPLDFSATLNKGRAAGRGVTDVADKFATMSIGGAWREPRPPQQIKAGGWRRGPGGDAFLRRSLEEINPGPSYPRKVGGWRKAYDWSASYPESTDLYSRVKQSNKSAVSSLLSVGFCRCGFWLLRGSVLGATLWNTVDVAGCFWVRVVSATLMSGNLCHIINNDLCFRRSLSACPAFWYGLLAWCMVC